MNAAGQRDPEMGSTRKGKIRGAAPRAFAGTLAMAQANKPLKAIDVHWTRSSRI